MKTTLLTAALITAASLANAADRALLIGINDYSAVAGAPILNGAVGDVDRMEAALTGAMGFPADGIIRLTDGAATYDAIFANVIDRLVSETRPGDRVVLYFAGLGTVTRDGQPALLAHDGDALLGQIPLPTLAEILDLIADREVTVILDTSFGEGPIGTRGVGRAAPDVEPTLGSNTPLWNATTAGQHAWEAIDRGVFTEFWTQAVTTGVADRDSDGKLTNGEVLAHVANGLSNWCDELPACLASGRGVTPVFSGDLAAPLITLATPEPEPVKLDPLIADDGAPLGYRETLGFVTDLFAPSNTADLSLAINDGDTVRIGQFVTMRAEAAKPGALILLDIDPNGAIAQVYPSRLSPDGATEMTAGQSLVIPSGVSANGRPLRMRVSEPAGQGLLLALFIEGDLADLTQILPAGLDGGALPEAGQSLYQISQSLLQLEADPSRAVRWSATYLPYRIEP